MTPVAVHETHELAPYVTSGLLSAADVHVATALTSARGDGDPLVLLGAALAVRAPRLQHVCLDLRDVHRLAAVSPDGADATSPAPVTHDWPDPDDWRARLAASPAVAVVAGDGPAQLLTAATRDASPSAGGDVAPLRLDGYRLYLDRLWRDERAVASSLAARAVRTVVDIDHTLLAEHLDALFDDPAPDRQRLAAATAATRHLTVIAGGPGTGKTTTVARLLAVLDAQARDRDQLPPSIALAAPTGKAAQRLSGSLREAAARLELPADDRIMARLRVAEASTLHSLLGWRPDNRTRFRHDRAQPLPHDVVVVDEASMVSLALIARLLEAMRPDARLVLVGDPQQLASVEAGSVLGDVVGGARVPRLSAEARASASLSVRSAHLDGTLTAPSTGMHDAIVVLDRVHRFHGDSGIADLADAIHRGDAERAIARLRDGGDLTWVQDPDGTDVLRPEVVDALTPVVTAAGRGDAQTALGQLDTLRVLCAHRNGPDGVTGWVRRVEAWVAAAIPDAHVRGPAYPGRPLLITANDHRARLVNGDVGVIVRTEDDDRPVALRSPDGTGVRLIPLSRLPAAETVYAMTVHKSQGSQFDHVVVVLPRNASPLLTRELLYTAVTRARRQVTVVATEAALRTAIATRAVRASGLGDLLRGRGASSCPPSPIVSDDGPPGADRHSGPTDSQGAGRG